MARKPRGDAETEDEGTPEEGRPAEAPAAVTTEEPAPPPPQPLGPQQERRHRGAYFVESGVNQIVHLARQGDEQKLRELAHRLLSQAYGL